MQPLISIVVPCYNQAHYLSDTLNSILFQTYSNWECIIVNDGSCDKTEEIALKYQKLDFRFKYVYQDNKGLPGARNTGLKLAKGEIVFSLDSDDMIEPNYIECVLDACKQCPNAKIIYTKLRFFGDFEEVWNGPEYSYDKLIWYNMLPPCAVYRKSEFDRVGGYNEWMKKGLEDWDFWLKMLTPNDLVYRIDKPLYLYRKRSSQTISMLDEVQKNKREVMSMLCTNHSDIYDKYKSDVVYFHSFMNDVVECNHEIDRLNDELSNIRHSTAYKLGKFLLRPLSWIKRKLK